MTCSNRRDLALLALRTGTGAVLIAHGAQKLFGWFGGAGLAGTAAAMEHMGFTPGRESAIAAGLGEAGFFAQSGGFEYPAFLGFTAAAVGLAGAGRYSVDHATGHVFDRPWMVALAFAGSAAAAAAVVTKRARAQARREEAQEE
ncbi:DoxX family protein [Streptomyces sp. NPDC059981]|uniref:DoxX family protein n=1 Tax=Streptomyces sp. NPDC059981 TaxID=3347023 RepID=UPI0036A780CC